MRMSDTKRTTYLSFQINQKPLDEIALKRGLAPSTLTGHLEEALLLGLPLDYGRLGIKLEDVARLEARIRKPPINSSNSHTSHSPPGEVLACSTYRAFFASKTSRS